MSDEQKCKACGVVVTLETGITLVMDDADLREFYCGEHNPDKGRGYTLSDLQKWREDNQAARLDYQMSQMERLGADVYFHVLGPTYPPETS
jgi:hypothetical protein